MADAGILLCPADTDTVLLSRRVTFIFMVQWHRVPIRAHTSQHMAGEQRRTFLRNEAL